MNIRAAFRTPTDALDPPVPAIGPDADAAASGRAPDAPGSDPDAGDQSFVDILRGLDLDALLAGPPVADFLFGDGRLYAPVDGFAEQVRPESWPHLQSPADPGEPLVLPARPDPGPLSGAADVAQVLPGLSEDDFILGEDVDLPLVLPGEDDVGEMLTLEPRLDLAPGGHSDMLTLDPGEGGFLDLHDADGWLF